jgi:hypothetical protein
MKRWQLIIACTGLLLILGINPNSVMAEEGLPGSPDFGYGVCLDLEGDHIEPSIQVANSYGLDWITIDFDWERYWPSQDISPNWQTLDNVMAKIGPTDLAVMISITNAPDWAKTINGPDTAATANLSLNIVQRYPNNVLAIELFPSANTSFGWGAPPNAKAYAELLLGVQSTLAGNGFNQTLLATGIEPSSNPQAALNFLEDLYALGIASFSPVISLRLPRLSHPPETQPGDVSGYTLRFYEDVRQIMLAYGQQNDLIWITRFDWNPGSLHTTADQAAWLQHAFLTMRSQLYIGVASFYCLNDPSTSTSLISPDGSPTAVFNALGELIAADKNNVLLTQVSQ